MTGRMLRAEQERLARDRGDRCDDDPFEASSLITALLVTALIGLALVLVPTLVAVPVLVAVALRAGGWGAGIPVAGRSRPVRPCGYAITEPHCDWEIQSQRDVVLLIVLSRRIAGGLGDRCAAETPQAGAGRPANPTPASGTARAGQPSRDYEPAAGTLTIPAGAREAFVQVLVLGDSRGEDDEHLTMTLSDPIGATPATDPGYVVIRQRLPPRARPCLPAGRSSPTTLARPKRWSTASLWPRQAPDVRTSWATQATPAGRRAARRRAPTSSPARAGRVAAGHPVVPSGCCRAERGSAWA